MIIHRKLEMKTEKRRKGKPENALVRPSVGCLVVLKPGGKISGVC